MWPDLTRARETPGSVEVCHFCQIEDSWGGNADSRAGSRTPKQIGKV